MGYLLLGLVILGAVGIYLVLRGLLGRVEPVSGDPATIAGQALAESDAFRGSSDPRNVPWAGKNRLAPPTQDGGAGVGGGDAGGF